MLLTLGTVLHRGGCAEQDWWQILDYVVQYFCTLYHGSTQKNQWGAHCVLLLCNPAITSRLSLCQIYANSFSSTVFSYHAFPSSFVFCFANLSIFPIYLICQIYTTASVEVFSSVGFSCSRSVCTFLPFSTSKSLLAAFISRQGWALSKIALHA